MAITPTSDKVPPPFSLVIFGASGDLTRRKLIPAVYSLYRQQLLPQHFAVIGFARRDKSDDDFRAEMARAIREFVPVPPTGDLELADFTAHLHYHRSNFQDPQGYRSLRQRLEKCSPATDSPGNCLFYLATQPADFPEIVRQLSRVDLCQCGDTPKRWSRVIVEKPFGRDLFSARELNAQLRQSFEENQIFRIDHFLGKETVQNLFVLRFANTIFEPIWNHRYIDHVQITVSETLGLEGRGAFYEQTGALRDIVQNHLMHLLSLVAMEPPVSLDADAVRDEKVSVLKALRPTPLCMVRAQYAAGTVRDQPVCGYREEPGVDPRSQTETFVALKVMIDNWRWSGVPFYLRTGKRMPVRITEIDIYFKAVPRVLFNVRNTMVPNCLAIRIQPREGIALQFQAKPPGHVKDIQPCRLFFNYTDAFGMTPPDAYERLLLDAAFGDATLFTRSDEVEAAWKFLQPIVAESADSNRAPLPLYPAGSWGPPQADDLIETDGRKWQLTKMPPHK